MGKYPIHFKVWSQMIKNFIRLAQGTINIIVNDAFACAIVQNTKWPGTNSNEATESEWVL